MDCKKLIKQMTLEDKVAFCSGADFWQTKSLEKYGIPSIMMCDGPHGLRKQENKGDHLGVNKSKVATCFPAACAIGSSWDKSLAEEIGTAIAKEALQEGISVVLGPGINIKRNPLCGRNFEYYSEDPYLAGEMAVSFIRGIEGEGIGASLKHFAANSQENKRFTSDSIMDERTLREIYLAGFETAVKKGKPSTVMCAYNKINGIHCSDNRYLLREILRDEWGFKGAVVTDWGAMNDRISAFEAGCDLEMPGGANYFDEDVIEAVKSGRLSEERIDEAVGRLLNLILKADEVKKKKYYCNLKEHHELSRRAAASSAVLLKNEESILPLDKGKKVALIGSFAKKIRYQGSGSSHVNPAHLVNVLEAMNERQINYDFYMGCMDNGSTDEILLKEAVEGAKMSDTAVVFAGLPENFESEGFDRETFSMPMGHIRMIEAVAKANPDTVVILMGGSPFAMPWLDSVKAVLNVYLPGQAGGEAIVDLLYGEVNPSGKLAETYPFNYDDVPSAGIFEQGGVQAKYMEGIYVGYRYYDKAGVDVRFPFGFGLSYTTFEYRDLRINKDKDNIEVSVCIKNVGNRTGAEVVELYVRDLQQGIHRPDKELKGFEKVFLEAGEEKRVMFILNKRSFAYYDVKSREWQVQTGDYDILIGASSREIRLKESITLEGTIAPEVQSQLKGTWYDHLQGKPEKADFEALLGRKVQETNSAKRKCFTMKNSIMEMQSSFIMRAVYKFIEKSISKSYGGIDYTNPSFKLSVISSTDLPIKNLCMISSGKMKHNIAEGLVHMANGRFIKGIRTIVRNKKQRRYKGAGN